MDDSASKENGIARQPVGSAFAVTESQTTAAVCFNPRRQFGFRASRNTRLSGAKPAAFSMVRASFRKSGHLEAMPTRVPDGAGSQCPKEETTERKRSVR